MKNLILFIILSFILSIECQVSRQTDDAPIIFPEDVRPGRGPPPNRPRGPPHNRHGRGRRPRPHRPPKIEVEVEVDPNLNKVITGRDINQAVKLTDEFIKTTKKLERTLKKNGLLAVPGTKEQLHQDLFGKNPLVIKITTDGTFILQTSLELSKT